MIPALSITNHERLPEPGGAGETGRSETLELADLRPDTRAAIERLGDTTDERGVERGATLQEIQAAIEALDRVSAQERESLLATIEGLLSRAEVDRLELPLWELQNAWWRVMRDRLRPLDDVEERVAVGLGFVS